jgi:hypothetical protein
MTMQESRLDKDFEGLMVEIDDPIIGKRNKPAWKCRACGLKWVSSELPPRVHTCNLREYLALLEHEQWAHWAEYMMKMVCLSTEDSYDPEKVGKMVEAKKRWKRQIETFYNDLTEKEKDSDRKWADILIFQLAGLHRYEELLPTMLPVDPGSGCQ